VKKFWLFLLLLVTILATYLTSYPSSTLTTEPVAGTLEKRFDLLVEQLEQQRQTLHVPGMAIAVVKDDEVILTHGFGISNIETRTPVTPETIFAIGSSTKAFTSTLVGMLADEGKMYWDDPVTKYLPYFQLDIESDNESDQVTIRDVLSHRTGFTRMGLLFASGQIPREEILNDANAAQPFVGFREKFYYSNVVYMSAGVAAGKVAGTDWDTLVTDKIFEPLGMKNTSTSISQAQTDPHLSLGYLWNEDLQTYKYKPMRNVDNIGPSGSINSNVLDMAQWVRFQLGEGEYESQRLISEANLRETWTSHIEIANGIDYGMGWMLREWKGQPVIEHGGNIDGFSAEVALLPESDLGFVLLTNASVSPLPPLSINMVWDTLLGEKAVDTGTSTEDYEPYIGEYIANFGTFKNTEFKVFVQNNRLAVNVPGQQMYELKDPDEEGKRYFVITNEIAVSFDRDEGGNITGMKIYQSGMVFDLPRKGTDIKPEIPLEELQKYLGSYRFEQIEVTAKVLIQNNRLAIDIPGQMAFELYLPDEEGIWVFRISPDISLRFNETKDGRIESLTLYQTGEEFIMPRIDDELLPSLEEILTLRNTDDRKAAIRDMGAYKVSSTVYSIQSGVRGKISLYVRGSNRYRVDTDYGKYGYSRESLNGDQAWVESSFGPFDELHSDLLEQVKRGHPYTMTGDWRDYYDSIQVLRSDILAGRKVYVLDFKWGNLPIVTMFVDSETGDVLKSTVVIMTEGDIGIPVTTLYEDFREVFGIRVPFRSISSNEHSGRIIFQDEIIETNQDIANDFFILTPTDR